VSYDRSHCWSVTCLATSDTIELWSNDERANHVGGILRILVVTCAVAVEPYGLRCCVSCPLQCGWRNIWFERLRQLSTALWLQNHLVWEVTSVVHCVVATEPSGLGGYVSCPLLCGCRIIWFGRLCQLSTALWLQNHMVWEVKSVVHYAVAAVTSGLGGCVSCSLHCGCSNIWFGKLQQLSTALWLQNLPVWEVTSVDHCIVAAVTSGLGS
jgi:hypothetical protein